MSSSLNLSLRKQGARSGDPEFCLAAYLFTKPLLLCFTSYFEDQNSVFVTELRKGMTD